MLGCFTGVGEFFQVDAAFHLVADIDDGLARLDGDDAAFDDSALFGGVDLEAFLQQGFEVFHGCFSAHMSISFLFIVFSLAMRLAPPVLPLNENAPSGKPAAASPFRMRAL